METVIGRIVVFASLFATISGVPAPAQAPPPRVADLAWMAGTWKGRTARGYDSEEVYSAPVNGLIMGMFRLTDGEKTLVLEFFTIRETPGGVEFRLRHFDPALEPWEKGEPIALKMASWDGRLATFEAKAGRVRRITFRKESDDAMTSRAEVVEEAGERVIEVPMKRAR